MSDFAKMPLSNVDAKGRDSNDRHYFGLVRSLTIGVRRMMDWCDRYDDQSGNSDTKKMAIGLMMAMAMLDRTKTPMSLFTTAIRIVVHHTRSTTRPQKQLRARPHDSGATRFSPPKHRRLGVCRCNASACAAGGEGASDGS